MNGLAISLALPLLLALQSGQEVPAGAAEDTGAIYAVESGVDGELNAAALEVPEKAPPLAAGLFTITLPVDTPVHLMVVSEVTTKTHLAGHRFRLRVNEPVIIDGIELIPVGATAWGEVISAESSGNLGKSGVLEARLLYIEVGDQNVAIEGTTSNKGKSGTAETVMGVIGLGVFGLFAKGNNAKIKAGEKITAFTTEDVEIELKVEP